MIKYTTKMPSYKDINHLSFYNFNEERVAIMVLGGYIIVRKPRILHGLNIIYLLCIIFLCIFLNISAVNTIILTSNDKKLAIQSSKVIFMLLVTIGVPTVRYLSNDSLNIATDILKAGMYEYEDRVLHDEQFIIKKRRVVQIRFFVKLITWMLSFNAASNAILVHLMQFFTITGDTSGFPLNPYLPLPVSMPFNTRTVIGFGAAFFSLAMALFFMNVTYICHEEIYISSSLQLCAELEILSHSLRNIERRAYFKLMKKKSLHDEATMRYLYESLEFQRCLYSCLRENIQHHQVLLRFRKAMKPYMETTTSIASLSVSLLMACELILLAENPGKNIALVMMLLSEMSSYLQISWVGQLITDKSKETKESLYATPWNLCDKKFNVLLGIMITNMQKPIVLRAKGINIEVSLETFGNMMTLGYKIMNLLREVVD